MTFMLLLYTLLNRANPVKSIVKVSFKALFSLKSLAFNQERSPGKK
jgi:hypothetical protein